MNQSENLRSIPPSMMAVLSGIAAFGVFGIAGMLFYCAVYPFGQNPPSPNVCWIAGTVAMFLGIASLAACYHFSTETRRGESRTAAVAAATDSERITRVVRTAEATMTGHAEKKLSMQDALLSQPALQQRMGGLVEALVQAAPGHYAMIHLLVEARKANGKTSILFTHGSPVLLNEYSTLVSDSIAHAAFGVIDSLLRQDDGFPGFEVVLRKTAATKWDMDCHRLDEPGPQWSNLPRYPLRVLGYGLSLAPVPETIFRWTRNGSAPGIVAAARKSSEPAFKQVRVILSDAGHDVGLAHGVAKAEEVIQIAEGPQTRQWVIETPIFRGIWPEGVDFRYPLASKTRFELVGADDTLIFVQGPVPNDNILDGMAAEGQREIGRGQTSAGDRWIELGYEVEGSPWRQRHYTKLVSPTKALVVTGQCVQSAARRVFPCCDEFTGSLSVPA